MSQTKIANMMKINETGQDHYRGYSIARVIDHDGSVEPYNEEEGDSQGEVPANVFWSIYGRLPTGECECIADFYDQSLAKRIYDHLCKTLKLATEHERPVQ